MIKGHSAAEFLTGVYIPTPAHPPSLPLAVVLIGENLADRARGNSRFSSVGYGGFLQILEFIYCE